MYVAGLCKRHRVLECGSDIYRLLQYTVGILSLPAYKYGKVSAKCIQTLEGWTRRQRAVSNNDKPRFGSFLKCSLSVTVIIDGSTGVHGFTYISPDNIPKNVKWN